MSFLAGVAVVAQLVGSAISAVGNVRHYETQAQAADYNSQVAENNAVLARQQAREEARRFDIEGQKALGTLRANIGAAGVTLEGSPLDVLEESARNVELDRLTILHAGEVRAAGFKAESQYEQFVARAQRSNKFFGAAASILSGFSKSGSLASGLF